MTGVSDQFVMPFSDAGDAIGSDLVLGFATDHRRLFTALEDGWMRPLPTRAGVLLGIGAYANEVSDHASKHPIFIRIRLRATRLPNMTVHVLRERQWVESSIREVRRQDAALYWPGTLPTFAISALDVQTEEQLARLRGLSRSVSNLDLSPFSLDVTPDSQPWLELTPPACAPKFVIPDDVDAVQGALSMAIWGIPRTPPWMDVLVSSLSRESDRLARAVAVVEAPWLRQAPWMPSANIQQLDTQGCLWLAASMVLRAPKATTTATPNELTRQIAAQATRLVAQESIAAVTAWKDSTIEILRGDASISLAEWRKMPVGIAIQLLLARPDPTAFKEWFKDLPNLPPAIAWTATVLCGLLRGYRSLHTQFRGGSVQREVVAMHALRSTDQTSFVNAWTNLQNYTVTWRNVLNCFVLSWNEREFARKVENSRSKWYTANLEDSNVKDRATQFAEQHDWPCIRKELKLSSGPVGVHGPGHIDTGNLTNELQVHGTVYMQIPESSLFKKSLDFGEFRRLVSIEMGPIPDPPISQIPRFQMRTALVPGLTYVPEFVSVDEEHQLMQIIDQSTWDTGSLRRRVQQYGWRYDYKDRRVDMNNRLGPLPEWAEDLALRLVSSGLLDQFPDQVIVNDYQGNQGISRHIDKPEIFADGIAMLSLNESWHMVFRPPSGGSKVAQLLDRRSVAIMKGDARYKWTHEIPNRKNEPNGITRRRRISLTFRTVVSPTR